MKFDNDRNMCEKERKREEVQKYNKKMKMKLE